MFKKLSVPFFLATTLTWAQMPDNTRKNKEDNKLSKLTAQDQRKGSSADIELTRKIRSDITDNDSLSTYAHNVKIVTLNGEVTLMGPVEKREEKSIIENHARKFAPNAKIHNNIKVMPDLEQSR
jgi:hyperosmotically inducible protein